MNIFGLRRSSGEQYFHICSKSKALYKNLTFAGSDMKPEDLAFAILAGLLDDYGTLVTILEATCNGTSIESP
jgi:hypothetical protein